MARPNPSGRETISRLARCALLSTLGAAALAARAAPAATPAAWTRARSLCDAGKLEEGWRTLAQVEQGAGKRPLPPDYWREVLACAVKASMPANALRAGRMLQREKRETPEDLALLETARAAVRVPEPDAVIPAEEAWIVRPRRGGVQLVSPPCGFAFEPRQDEPLLPPVQKRGCSVRTWTPPLPGKAGPQRANIVVLARVPAAGERVEDYAALVLPTWKPAKLDGYRCPGARCVVYGARIPGLYGKDGDSVRLAVGFERDEPEFPGLALEDPGPRVKRSGASGGPVYGRFRGKLLYLVMFDSAASVAERAKADYRRFLAELRVE